MKSYLGALTHLYDMYKGNSIFHFLSINGVKHISVEFFSNNAFFQDATFSFNSKKSLGMVITFFVPPSLGNILNFGYKIQYI
jgi:hypothetical protein